MLADTLIVLDFETTGLRPDQGDRITEVAALRLQQGQVVASYESLVNCGRHLPTHIRSFTGITQRMIDTAPPPQQVFPELLHFIGPHPVVSHNAAFDQGFLEMECEQLNLHRAGYDFICTVLLARELVPEVANHSLNALVRHFHLPTAEQHRAAVDALCTTRVLLKLVALATRMAGVQHIDVEYLRSLALPRGKGSSVLRSA